MCDIQILMINNAHLPYTALEKTLNLRVHGRILIDKDS